jgi:acyl dehydratase
VDVDRDVLRGRHVKRTLELTPELLRLYSRRGNFHSDPDAASALGYDKLVAQGMQVAGPAYGLLLDEWGEDFLAHGELELKFVGVATDGETVEATVEVDGDAATITVENITAGRTSVVGTATRLVEEES